MGGAVGLRWPVEHLHSVLRGATRGVPGAAAYNERPGVSGLAFPRAVDVWGWIRLAARVHRRPVRHEGAGGDSWAPAHVVVDGGHRRSDDGRGGSGYHGQL